MISLKWTKQLTNFYRLETNLKELHLKQPRFIHSACEPFNKHHERNKKFRQTENLKHLYRNELGKACFPHDAAYCDSNDLAKRTISDNILKNRACEIVRNYEYGECHRELASMVYIFFDRKTGSGVSVNEQLVDKLHRPVIKKFKRKKSLREI